MRSPSPSSSLADSSACCRSSDDGGGDGCCGGGGGCGNGVGSRTTSSKTKCCRDGTSSSASSSASVAAAAAAVNDISATAIIPRTNSGGTATTTTAAAEEEAAAAAVIATTSSQCPSAPADVGHAPQCQGCPGRAACQASGGTDPDQSAVDIRMGAIKHRILVLSGKGGVGKSFFSVLLVRVLAQAGAKVGCCDLDICGPSIPRLLGTAGIPIVSSDYGWVPAISPHGGSGNGNGRGGGGGIKTLSVGSLLPDARQAVIWRGPRKTATIKRFLKDTFWGRLDHLIFDTPPGTSDEHLTVVKLLGSACRPRGAILVTTPQRLAMDTVRREITFCRKMGIKILGLVENMAGYVCPCCNDIVDAFGTMPVEAPKMKKKESKMETKAAGSGSGGEEVAITATTTVTTTTTSASGNTRDNCTISSSNIISEVEQLAIEYEIPYLGSVPLDPRLTAAMDSGQDVLETCAESPALFAVKTVLARLLECLPGEESATADARAAAAASLALS